MISLLVVAACTRPVSHAPKPTPSTPTTHPVTTLTSTCCTGTPVPGPDLLAWIDPITAPYDLEAASVAATSDGDVVVVMAAPLGGTVHVVGSPVPFDAFGTEIARFAPDGSVRWARPLHASDPENVPESGYVETELLRVGSGSDGALYVAGSVQGAVRFGPDTVDEIDVPGVFDRETSHGVLARLDADGSPTWVVDLTNDASVYIDSVAGTSDGGVVIGGTLSGALTLGAGEAGEVTLPDEGQTTYVARYRADHTLLWAWEGPPGAGAMVAPAADRIWAAMYYVGPATLDNGYVLPDPTGVALVALDDAGDTTWSDRLAASNVVLTGLATTTDGGLGAVGYYGYTDGEPNGLVLSPGTPQETTFADRGDEVDIVLAKWDTDGVLAWARSGTGLDPGADLAAIGVAATPDGGIEATGFAATDLNLDDGTSTTRVPTVSSDWDLWYARYDPAGTLVHGAMAGGVPADLGLGVAWGADGPVVVGSMQGKPHFGVGEAGERALDFGVYGGIAVFGLFP